MRTVPEADALLTNRHHVLLLKIAAHATTGFGEALIARVALKKGS